MPDSPIHGLGPEIPSESAAASGTDGASSLPDKPELEVGEVSPREIHSVEEPPPLPEDNASGPPPLPHSDQAWLISYASNGQKEVYLVSIPLTRIGRLPENEIAIANERAISAFHCEIRFESGVFRIADLGSTNGVLVNNVRIENKPLTEGDKIKLGFKIFRFTREKPE